MKNDYNTFELCVLVILAGVIIVLIARLFVLYFLHI